jgi:3-hydroxyisobutyryl-CoA hydrolase
VSLFADNGSELGIATHYVAESSLPDLVRQITHHPKPTAENLSKLIASFSLPASTSSAPSSKSNPDANSPVSLDIRQFLDNTFSAPSVREIHNRLVAAASNDGLSDEVKKWAEVQRGYLEEKSPTGMAVALEGYRLAKNSKRLDQALQNGTLRVFSVIPESKLTKFRHVDGGGILRAQACHR